MEGEIELISDSCFFLVRLKNLKSDILISSLVFSKTVFKTLLLTPIFLDFDSIYNVFILIDFNSLMIVGVRSMVLRY